MLPRAVSIPNANLFLDYPSETVRVSYITDEPNALVEVCSALSLRRWQQNASVPARRVVPLSLQHASIALFLVSISVLLLCTTDFHLGLQCRSENHDVCADCRCAVEE